jgi:hypothetical protein
MLNTEDRSLDGVSSSLDPYMPESPRVLDVERRRRVEWGNNDIASSLHELLQSV